MTQYLSKLPVAAAALLACASLFYGALAPVNANVGYFEVAANAATQLA